MGESLHRPMSRWSRLVTRPAGSQPYMGIYRTGCTVLALHGHTAQVVQRVQSSSLLGYVVSVFIKVSPLAASPTFQGVLRRIGSRELAAQAALYSSMQH